MNEITERVVREVAMGNKAVARRNDITFDFLVRDAHWDELVRRYGWRLKERALVIWRWYHPEMFELGSDGVWYLRDYVGQVFDVDLALSGVVGRVLRRKCKREVALQLEDWGDLPVRLVDPQIRMEL